MCSSDLEAKMKVYSKTNSIYTSFTKLAIAKGAPLSIPDTVMAESLILELNNYNGKTAEIGFKESNTVMQYITLKAYKFPFIIILWMGTLIMALGFIISMVRRIQKNRL